MEFLIAAGITVITTLTAWASRKYGLEMGRALIYVFAFALSGGAAYFWSVFSGDFKAEVMQLFASQMALYEVFVKTLIKPAIDPKAAKQVQILPTEVTPT